jgi:hypothetical protein
MEIKVPQKKRLWSARLPVINPDVTVHVRELTEPKQTRRSVDAEKYSLVSSKSPRKPHIAIQSSRHLLAASRSSSSSNSEFYLFIFTAPRLLQRFLLNLLPLPTNQRPLLRRRDVSGSHKGTFFNSSLSDFWPGISTAKQLDRLRGLLAAQSATRTQPNSDMRNTDAEDWDCVGSTNWLARDSRHLQPIRSSHHIQTLHNSWANWSIRPQRRGRDTEKLEDFVYSHGWVK